MKDVYLDSLVKVEIITNDRLDEVICFQKDIIDNMENKEFFCPLTKEEFLVAINGRDNVYFLKFNDEVIGLFVATCDIDDVISEYQLDNNNVMLIDSIMISENYRGRGLQRKILNYLEIRAKELNVDSLVATVHPDNIYSLNNFLVEGYQIINRLKIHGGPRCIVYKEVED